MMVKTATIDHQTICAIMLMISCGVWSRMWNTGIKAYPTGIISRAPSANIK